MPPQSQTVSLLMGRMATRPVARNRSEVGCMSNNMVPKPERLLMTQFRKGKSARKNRCRSNIYVRRESSNSKTLTRSEHSQSRNEQTRIISSNRQKSSRILTKKRMLQTTPLPSRPILLERKDKEHCTVQHRRA